MKLSRESKDSVSDFSLGEREDGLLVRYEVTEICSDGQAILKRQLYGSWNTREVYCNPEEEIEYILRYVNRS